MENNLKELSIKEMNEINGGESIWYWVAYGVGSTIKYLGHDNSWDGCAKY
ncbi:bacteriocin [Flavobacterium columnare]|nr:bacteriocin [Flavobacterium columnare]